MGSRLPQDGIHTDVKRMNKLQGRHREQTIILQLSTDVRLGTSEKVMT